MQSRNLQPIYYYFEHTNCYTYFTIIGDFSPNTITEMLGLEPEKFWKIGDKRKNGTIYNFSLWKFGTCDEYDIDVDKQMLKTITPLLSKIETLNEIKETFEVSFFSSGSS